MNSLAIRQKFIDFFQAKGHQAVPPAPLIHRDDASLMFANSGMVQFKSIFLGHQKAPYRRVVNSQPCLRIAGKHNDLEEVGLDTYHHTFFEMLGHWSFGDYFKKEAIDYAWELLTQVYGLSPDRLYATIFGGAPGDSLPEDEETKALWERYLPADRILSGGKRDNFWEMGAQGPCGPCTEVHIDLRSGAERAAHPGHTLVNGNHPQVIELGNWVFIQYNRRADGALTRLPMEHIDTGIGLERLSMILQGKKSTYDTDLFTPLITWLAAKTGTPYGAHEKKDIAMRVIADHLRALVFSIAEGVLPSSQKEGYVLRRLLRRAVRYGYSFLDFSTPVLHELVPLFTRMMAPHYPPLAKQRAHIEKTIHQEEENFLRTLQVGIKHFHSFIQEIPAGTKKLAGEKVFRLYDTYGFPQDLTALMAKENGYAIDQKGFVRCMNAQKTRAKKAAHTVQGNWQFVHWDLSQTSTFVGYDRLSVLTHVGQYRTLEKGGEVYYQILLKETPFYPEGGGQVGDEGALFFGEEKIEVLDTQRENDLILHCTKRLPPEIKTACRANVHIARRKAIARNHTATHLLHAALRHRLGNHVQQCGSLVTPEGLRFDFTHGSKISLEELRGIEQEINKKIRANTARQEWRHIPLQQAKNMGATALFAEKYGTHVRVIAFNVAHSLELCGGTHVAATGEISYCKLLSEKGIAAGVRRIEAITGEAVEAWLHHADDSLLRIASLCPGRDPASGVVRLLEENKRLRKELDHIQDRQIQEVIAKLPKEIQQAPQKGRPIIEQVDLSAPHLLKKLLLTIKKIYPASIIVLLSRIEQKGALAIWVPPTKKSLGTAQELLKKLLPHRKEAGSGGASFAFAMGFPQESIPAIQAKARALLHEKQEKEA